jgi:hypothetical protein
MVTWQIWFADGRIERCRRDTQLSNAEMEMIVGGYMDVTQVWGGGRLQDTVTRWDAHERRLPVNDRATSGRRTALQKQGLTALPADEICGDVIVLGYALLRRGVAAAKGLNALRFAAEQGMYIDFSGLDRAATEMVLQELLEIEREADRTGYKAAVQNAIAQYRRALMETCDDEAAWRSSAKPKLREGS